MEIVFASANKHKVEEVNAICQNCGVNFILPPEGFDPIENGSTFEENSYIKAKTANDLCHKLTLADDSGLCVEALNGAPGLYSARYAGTQQEKIEKLLKELDGIENRKAKFVCAMTLLDKNGNVIFKTTGECKGSIIKAQKGVNGFGYDPIFLVENSNLTMAEMSENDKNAISHRGNALRKVLDFLKSM